MFYLPVFLVISGIIFSFLQVSRIITYPNSKMNVGWFFSVTIFMGILSYLGLTSSGTQVEKLIYFLLLSLALWSNIIKFTLGLIQKKEVTVYNRFEHVATGMLAFYGLHLIHFANLFPITFHEPWALSLFILLIVNMISVGIEMGELAVDLYLGKNYMIGPSVHDTNWDILCTFLGSLLGFILWLT